MSSATLAQDDVPRVPPYRDPSELAGMPTTDLLAIPVLIVAAGADLAAFSQMMSLLLPGLTTIKIWAAILGFTACSLALAHFAGRLYRDRHEGYAQGSGFQLIALAVTWLGLGVVAFLVRFMIAQGSDTTIRQGATTSPHSEVIGGAWVFLMLHLASGLLTAIAAYTMHHPLRARCRKAAKAYGKARKHMKSSHANYERAFSVLQQHLQVRAREGERYDAALNLRKAVAWEMKERARYLMAGRLQDPSATTGLIRPDSMPELPPPPQPHSKSWIDLTAPDSAPTDSSETRR